MTCLKNADPDRRLLFYILIYKNNEENCLISCNMKLPTAHSSDFSQCYLILSHRSTRFVLSGEFADVQNRQLLLVQGKNVMQDIDPVLYLNTELSRFV